MSEYIPAFSSLNPVGAAIAARASSIQWRGPLCISKRAELDTVIGPEVEFTAGICNEQRIFTEALEDWLAESEEISDVQQAEIHHSEWGTVRVDGAVWLSQGGYERPRGLDKCVG